MYVFHYQYLVILDFLFPFIMCNQPIFNFSNNSSSSICSDLSVKDSPWKYKHLFPVVSYVFTKGTAGSRDSIVMQAIRLQYPSSSGIELLILLHAWCKALIHTRSTWVSYQCISSYLVNIENHFWNLHCPCQELNLGLLGDSQAC